MPFFKPNTQTSQSFCRGHIYGMRFSGFCAGFAGSGAKTARARRFALFAEVKTHGNS
jgi:hypothetical protein